MMQDYQKDEFFRAVDDVVTILEKVNLADLAHEIVKLCPDRAGILSLAIDFELMDKDISENECND
jgi:hypothetical protein